HTDGQQQHVLEVDDRAVPLELFVAGVDGGDLGRVARGLAGGPGGGGRVVVGDRLGDLGPFDLRGDVPQFGAVEPDAAACGRLRRRGAASGTSGAVRAPSRGSSPPTGGGQKYCSWRSAAEWKVRACTPPAPSWRSRPRISPAARAVKVTASTVAGWSIPART